MATAQTPNKPVQPAKPIAGNTSKDKVKPDYSDAGKAARFKKIAARRTVVILKTLNNLSNCANRNVYAYTDAQLETIFKSISEGLAACKSAFEKKAARDKISVNL